jgi:hypothetical protein
MAGFRRMFAVPCRHFAPRSKNQVLDTESQPILLIQELSVEDLQKSQRLVGNRKRHRRDTHYLDASDFEWDANRLSFRVTALALTIQGTIDVDEKFCELRAQRDTGQRLLK